MFHPDDLSLISGIGVGSISSNNGIASLMKFILPNSSVSLVDQPFLYSPTSKLESILKINKLKDNKSQDDENDNEEESFKFGNLLDIVSLTQNFDEIFQPSLLVPHPIIIKPKNEKEFFNINDAIITDFIVPSIKNALHEFPEKMPLLFEHLDKFIGSTNADPNDCDIAFASGVSEILFESIYSKKYDTQTLANILNSCIKFIVQFGSSIDCFLLARAWIQSSPRPNLDLKSLIEVIGYEKLPKISSNPTGKEKIKKMPLFHFFNNLSGFKISMYSGYLYVACYHYGVVKVGTGYNGTVPGSFICRNASLSSYSPKFICVTNEVVIYGACLKINYEEELNFVFFLDAVTLKVIYMNERAFTTGHECFCACNKFIYMNDWNGTITKLKLVEQTNIPSMEEVKSTKLTFDIREYFLEKIKEKESDNDESSNENVLNYEAFDEFTDGISYYIFYLDQIIEISLQDGTYKIIPIVDNLTSNKYRYVFDSVTTQFYIIDDQGLSIITDNKTFGRIPLPNQNLETPLDIIHFLVYSHSNLQSRFTLSPSFNLLFMLIQSIVPPDKNNSNSNKKIGFKQPEIIPSPRSSSSLSISSLSKTYNEFIDFSPVLLEASIQSLKNGNNLSDDLFNIFLERLNFFYENYPVVTLAFIATYLTSEQNNSKSEIILKNKIDFSILFEAVSQLPCLHKIYIIHFLSDEQSLKVIGGLFDNLDHKGVAFLNVLSESLAYHLKRSSEIIKYIQNFIELIHYSSSPLFYSFLESFFYVFHSVSNNLIRQSEEMLIRILPSLSDPMRVNTINDESETNAYFASNEPDVLSLNNIQLCSDIPINAKQDCKVSHLLRIFDLELPVASKIYLKLNFQQKITSDQVCLFIYTTKSQKEHEAFLPAPGSPPTDKIEVEFNSSYMAVDVDVNDNNSKDNNNDENGNNNTTIEFTYSLSCTIPILTATETLMNLNIFQLYWCKALALINNPILLTIPNPEYLVSNSTSQKLFDSVFQNIPHEIYHKIFYKFKSIDINLISTPSNIEFIKSKLSSKNFNERIFYLSIASRTLDCFSLDELLKNWKELFIIFSFVMNHKNYLQEKNNEQNVLYKFLQNLNNSSTKILQTKNKYFKLKPNNLGFDFDFNLHLDCFVSITDFQKYSNDQFSFIIKALFQSSNNGKDLIINTIFELINMIKEGNLPIISSNLLIILKIITLIPNDSSFSSIVDKNAIKSFVLSNLTKCIDDSLEIIFLSENIFYKFDIKIDEIDENVKNILDSVEVNQGNLENKYYFQCCRLLRHFMTVDALNNLSEFIEKVEVSQSDDKNSETDISCYNYKGSCLGTLMILSSRYSPLSINDKYAMVSHCNKDINLTINDYNSILFSFETDNGLSISRSPFDFHTYLPLVDNSFYKKVLEDPLPKLSEKLVTNVFNQINGKYKSLAIDALCDLSINSLSEPINYLNSLDQMNFLQKRPIDEDDSNYLIEIEQEPTPNFIIDQNNAPTSLDQMQEAYKTDNIKSSKFKKSKEFSVFLRSFFSAKHKPVNVVFLDQPGTDFKIILSRYAKYKLLLNDDHNREICIWSITDRFIASVMPGTKSSIIECYFGISPSFQIVYLKLGSHFWINPVQYTPNNKKVRLGIVGNGYTFDAFVIDKPPDLLIPSFTPQYLLIDNSIKSFEKFEKKSKKLENDFSLLPFVKNEGQIFYMEVTHNCKYMKISLSPTFMASLVFYTFEFPPVENGQPNQTIGISIDFMQNLVGIKADNKIIKESLKSFDYLPHVCITFRHDEAKTIEFNFGSKPFLNMTRILPAKITKNCTVEYKNEDSNDKCFSYSFSPSLQTPFKPTGLSFPIEIGRPAFLNINSKPLIGMIRNDRFLTSTFSSTVPLLVPLIKDFKELLLNSSYPFGSNFPNSQFLLNLVMPSSSSSSASRIHSSSSASNPTKSMSKQVTSSEPNEEEEEESSEQDAFSSSFIDYFTSEASSIVKSNNTENFNDLMLWSTPFDSVENVEIATIHSLFFLRDRIDPQYHKEFSRLAKRSLYEYDGNFCNPHNLTIKNYEFDLTHKSEIIIHIFMNLIKSNFIENFNKFDSYYNKLLIQSINCLSTIDLHTDYPFSDLLFELIKFPPLTKTRRKCGNINFIRHYLIESAKMFTNLEIFMYENGNYRSIHAHSIGNFERISDLECDAMIFLTTRIGSNKHSKIKLVDKYQNKISLKAFYDHKFNVVDYKNNYNCIQTLLRSEFIFDKIRYYDAIMCSFVPIEFKHPEKLLYDDTHSIKKSYCEFYMKQKKISKLDKKLNQEENSSNENDKQEKSTKVNKIKYCQKIGFAFAIHFVNHVYEYIKQSKDKIIANLFNKYFLRPVFYELVYKKACVFDRYVAKWMSILITNRDLFTEKAIVSYKSIKALCYDQFQFDQLPYNELSYVVRLIMMTGDCYVSKYVLSYELDMKYKKGFNSYDKFKKEFKKIKTIKETDDDDENGDTNYSSTLFLTRDSSKDDYSNSNQSNNYDYSSDDEFEENGLYFNNYNDEIVNKISEIDEINEVSGLLMEERDQNEIDESIIQEQRRRISTNFIIDRSFSKRAISIYLAIAAELLNPLGCHLQFFNNKLVSSPFLTHIITNEFFKWRPDLKPPTISLFSISPNLPYIHRAKKGSIPIILGNPPPMFRIQGYEYNQIDYPENEKKQEIKNENPAFDSVSSLLHNIDHPISLYSNENDDDEKSKSPKNYLKRHAVLEDFDDNIRRCGWIERDTNESDQNKYSYFIISNPSSLPIPMRFQISFLSDFLESKNLPDGRKLIELNRWIYELKQKWNLHYEAVCFFIHTLLNSFKCKLLNFKIFEYIIKNIFPNISIDATLFQLMMTSFRMRTGFRFKSVYNYNIDDDLDFIDIISPDCIKIPRDCYKRSAAFSSINLESDESATTTTAANTTISSDISAISSINRNIDGNNNNSSPNLNNESNLSLDQVSNENNNNNENIDGQNADNSDDLINNSSASILASIQSSRNRSNPISPTSPRNVNTISLNSSSDSNKKLSAVKMKSVSQSAFNISSILSFGTTSFESETRGKKLSDFYIDNSHLLDFCFPHNYKELSNLSEKIASNYVCNDMFTNECKSVHKKLNSEWEIPAFLPRESATTKRDLDAFVAFGTHLVVAFETGSAVPFIVSRVVIRYAFDCKLTLDDFADVDLEFALKGSEEKIEEKIAPIKKQLEAIRIGVLKMRPIRYHSYFKLDFFPRVVQMMPFVDILSLMDENENIKPFIVFKSVLYIVERIKQQGKRYPITKNCII